MQSTLNSTFGVIADHKFFLDDSYDDLPENSNKLNANALRRKSSQCFKRPIHKTLDNLFVTSKLAQVLFLTVDGIYWHFVQIPRSFNEICQALGSLDEQTSVAAVGAFDSFVTDRCRVHILSPCQAEKFIQNICNYLFDKYPIYVGPVFMMASKH